MVRGGRGMGGRGLVERAGGGGEGGKALGERGCEVYVDLKKQDSKRK